MTTFLIIEDEAQISRYLKRILAAEYIKILHAETLQRGLALAAARPPDLVLLDLGLPDGEGLDFIQQFRTWSDKPIIVLSARHEESVKIMALDRGADDYLTKPFGVGELQARVRVALRRRGPNTDRVKRFGEIELDVEAHTVKRAGEIVHLTAMEYKLMELLVSHAGKVLTQHFILSTLWGPNAEDSQYLRVYIGHLRKKLEPDPRRPQHFITENGIGYRFVE
ncbi:response regulator [Rosenbergiella epipactidis]|uniref:response regulator n=1 Tax=Rosenbergiella epipactidis TaxID=1544694 RepID=UPI001F4E5BE1|nr:response regulator [Rosenbergiella epipactidis]